MVTQQEVIKKFMKSLDKTSKKGEAALNEAIKACSPFKNFKELKAALIRDCKTAKSNGDDFLKTYCGIDYSTDDSGAITGSDAGGTVSKNDADIIPESGSLKTYKKTSFTKKGLTVKLGDGKTYNDLTASEKFIWNGLYTWWVEGALNLVEESYGENFGFGKNSSATVKEISVTFYNEKSNTSAMTSSSFNTETGKAYNLRMEINMYHWKTLKDNLSKANSEFDKSLAHEFTHAVMAANILCEPVYSLPGFISEGLSELTVGVENKWSTGDASLKNLAANPSKLDNALDITNTGTGEGFMYSGGFTFFRYLARQAGDLTVENTTESKVLTFYGNDKITNLTSKVAINSGAGNDTIYNWDWDNTKVTIESGTGNDVIANVGAYSTIEGGTGNDSIRNWNDSVKIYGGTGNDTILNDSYYDKANKVTIDGGTGNDRIQNYGNSVSIVGGTGNDTVWNYGSKVTIKGGTGRDYLVGGDYADTIYGGSDNDSLWGGKGNDKLYGDAGNDKLIGDAGADKLYGGAGNDSLWGGAGSDKFIYAKGDGKDVIFGFDNKDTLTFDNLAFTTAYSASKGTITLSVSGGSVTLKEFTATTFHINNDIYKISGSKLKKQ